MVVRRLDYLSGKSVTGPRDDISASRSVLNSVLSKAQRSMLSRLASRQTLYRSFATIPKHAPSSAYIDAHRSLGPAVTATPPDLKPQERNTLDSALRVDQAGEIAANYIYKGQLAVLGRDPKLAPLIQASCKYLCCDFEFSPFTARICGSKRRNTWRLWTNCKFNTTFAQQY